MNRVEINFHGGGTNRLTTSEDASILTCASRSFCFCFSLNLNQTNERSFILRFMLIKFTLVFETVVFVKLVLVE